VYPFFTTVKKHGFKLWIANLVGFITFILCSNTLIFFGNIAIDSLGPSSKYLTDPFSITQFTQYELSKWIFPLLLFFLPFYTIMVLFISLLVGGGIGITAEAVTNNRSSISNYFTYGLKSMGKIFGVFFFSTILLNLIQSIIALLLEFTSSEGLAMLVGPLFILIPLVFVMIILNAPVITIVEQTGVLKSLSLSFQLFKRSFGNVLVTILCLIGSTFLSNLVALTFLPIASLKISAPFVIADALPLIPGVILITLTIALDILIVVYRYIKYLRPLLRIDGLHVEAVQ
jgi:hypothetical protein